MIIIAGILSLLIGLFVLIFTLTGAPNDATLWLIGVGLTAFGIAGPVLKISADRLAEKKRRAAIMIHENEWGKDICELVIAKRINLDMTKEMVRLAWGQPSYVDEKEVTKKSAKERWVYGQPRQGARYIWFSDEKVSKIKT